MKQILIALTLLISASAGAQVLKFKIEGLKDTTVHLAKYFGPKLYYADTVVSKNGYVQYDGSKHQSGMYAVVLPGSKYFEFIHDKEAVDMYVSDQNDLIGSMKVNKSINNDVFYKYITFMTEHKKKMTELTKQYEAASENSPEREKIKEQSKVLNDEVVAYQKKVVAENPGRFIAILITMTMDVQLPEPPRNADGVITDSNYVYNYYVTHYWDGVNFKDARIVNTPVYHNKLDKFFSKDGILQIPDTIIKYGVWMLDQMDMTDQTNKVFQYTLHHLTYKYETMQIMGMDRVFWYLGTNYYCEPNKKAYWMTPENLTKLCERTTKIGRTLIGNYAPMLILPDTTEQNWINMYKVPAEYTVLYFWDPNCGHCKKTTPKLQTLYEKKLKDRGIEVYAVAKATGTDFEDWKKFIITNKLTFINVGLTKNVYDQAMKDPRPLLQKTTLESLNYSDTYDVYSTPRIFVLDKDKKIRFKQIGISQLEMIMDDITGHASDVKLFPEEDEEEEEHH
ncbi:MAG: redoxin domain-containing protein [Bacteroidetes bacterium]|nr:redoxin domain-containing protein [Bacteroidota bacterium]